MKMNTNNQWFRNGFVYLLILVALGALFFNIFQPSRPVASVPISRIAQDVQNDLVKKISVHASDITVEYKDGTMRTASIKRDSTIEGTLKDLGVADDKRLAVDIVYENSMQLDNILGLLGTILPFILIAGLLFFPNAPGTKWEQSSALLWKVEGPNVQRGQADRDFCGCRRSRRG